MERNSKSDLTNVQIKMITNSPKMRKLIQILNPVNFNSGNFILKGIAESESNSVIIEEKNAGSFALSGLARERLIRRLITNNIVAESEFGNNPVHSLDQWCVDIRRFLLPLPVEGLLCEESDELRKV